MNAQPLQPGDLVQLAGWPSAAALVVQEIHGDQVVVQAGSLQITAHRSAVSAVHRRQVQA
jgi:hypothetical protein